jgi:branched-chain amino acid transport system substrate-binding protein
MKARMLSKEKILLICLTILITNLIMAIAVSREVFCQGKTTPIVIGVTMPLGSIQGQDVLRSVQLAAEEINTKGGVSIGGSKHNIEVVSADTREHEPGFPTHEALMAMEKLITEKKPHAIIGGFRSEVVLAVFDLIAKYKVPYITPIAMTPLFEEKLNKDREKHKYMFRAGNKSIGFYQLLEGTMGFLQKEYNVTNVYILTTDLLAWRAVMERLIPDLKKTGWNVLAYDKVPLGTTDFSSSLNRAKAEKAQVLLLIIETPEGGILLKQAKAMKVPALIVGMISAAVQQIAWETFKGEVEGSLQIIQEIGDLPVKAWPRSVEFQKNYEKRWGVDKLHRMADHGPAPAYDSVYALAAAMERAGTLAPDSLVSALEKTDMLGAIGRVRFNEDHNIIYGFDPKEAAAGCAFQWKAPGVRVPVFPKGLAEGRIEFPAYAK